MDNILSKLSTTRTVDNAIELLGSTISIDQEIAEAIDFAIASHQGQFRKSGEPYVVHPILVASITVSLGGDKSMVIASILHDTVEDTSVNIKEVKEKFGEDVATLVDGLTKIDKIRKESLLPSSKTDEKLIKSALSFQKILVASIKDIRVLVIKLCDRVHNMFTLDALPKNKQIRIAEETLVVYAPIAHRLGISKLKNILEDKSFYYIFPTEYQKIDNYLQTHKESLNSKLNSFVSKVTDILLMNGFSKKDFYIQSRIKHYYSIYSKMQKKGVNIDEILDLLAIRIITNDVIDCYKALGILHTHFRPLIARFKDYIALPKDNGYQTIHTTVFDKSYVFEIQIRTKTMHHTAELGVAAHWKYKQSGLTPKLEWLQSMQYNSSDNIEDFYELAKNDLFSEEIAVYSPKGDVYTLPQGATALDFAYAVHTHVGSKAIEAYINKEKAPLLTKLKSGDLVRIVTGDRDIIRCTWIEAVKTSRAKHLMKTICSQKIKHIDKETTIAILMFVFNEEKETIINWIKEEGYENSLHKALKFGGLLEEMVKKFRKKKKLRLGFFAPSIKKYELNNIIVYSPKSVKEVGFDYCCHPKTGDDILAFYKKSKVIIHHKMCENAQKELSTYPPMVKAMWDTDHFSPYKIVVTLENKKGALANFVSLLAKEDINITSIELGKSDHDFTKYCELDIELPKKNYQKIKQRLEKNFKIIDFVSTKDAYN